MKKLLGVFLVAMLSAFVLSACSSSSDDNGGSGYKGISIKGGDGSVAGGGSGGSFTLHTYEGNNIKIAKAGHVDTAFDTSFLDENKIVSAASLTFGDVPLEVTTHMTISAYATNPTTTGEYYLAIATSESNTLTLFKWNGSGGDPVTGVHIHKGATLTLGLNYSRIGGNGLDTAFIRFTKDFWNQGTITAMNLLDGATEVGGSTRTADGTDLDRGGLLIISNGLILNDGSVMQKGEESATDAGGNGGMFYVRGDWDGSWTGQGYANNKLLVNRGTVNTSGGKGHTNGGKAGGVDMEGAFGIWNSGDVTAMGGNGSTMYGGDGADIWIASWNYNAPTYNSATLNASGGDGRTGGGSAGGGGIESGWSAGGADVVNSGVFIANGGNALTLGSGGWGAGDLSAPIYLASWGGNIRSSGAIEAKGGKGVGASSSGGGGGTIYMYTYASTDPWDTETMPAGGIHISGNITLDAGSGESGNSGGSIQIFQGNYPAAGDIELLGYGDIDLGGGKGKTTGGSGGSVSMYANSGNQGVDASFYNDVAFNTSGGNGTTGTGGGAGNVNIDLMNSIGYNGSVTFMFENHGNITAMGGSGANGGAGNYIQIYSWRNLQNTGKMSTVGGDASNKTTGVGGAGSYINYWAVGDIVNSGVLDTSGGYGALTGGAASGIVLNSYYGFVTNSGSMFANGGNANTTLASTGGAANAIALTSYSDSGAVKLVGTLNTASTLQVVGGKGATPGSPGAIIFDTVDVTPSDYTLP